MLNTYINVTKSSSSTTCITPEKIEVDIIKEDEQSFFVEFSRNSEEYKNLLGENPFITKREWTHIKEGEYHFDRREVLAGGYYKTIETPVKILRLTYVGEDKFLFELKNKSV